MRKLNLPGVIVTCISLSSVVFAGSLEPSAPPASTMKTLGEIEPRTIINYLPFTISTSGSYYLASNLTCKAASSGITIDANDVTLDLNGFTIKSYVTSAVCNGILVSAHKNILVKNGHILGWSGCGIDASAAFYCRFEKIVVTASSLYGIRAGKHAAVVNCTANSNTYTGIVVDSNSLVAGSVASENKGCGIFSSSGSSAKDCVASGNSLHGISAYNSAINSCTANYNRSNGFNSEYSTVSNCSSSYNRADGFYLAYSNSANCMASSNSGNGFYVVAGTGVQNCTAISNAHDGFYVMSGSSVSGCSSKGHTGYGYAGIHINSLTAGVRIDGNTISGNNIGIYVGTAKNTIIRNSVLGNTTNFSLLNTDNICPISTSASTDPWTNFSL